MKFNKSSQLLLVSAASLLVAGLMTACSTATTDFVFVSSSLAAGPSSYGEIDVFEINRVSGYMRQIPTSPFFSGGRDPVAEATSPDNTTLYVVNQLDNSIVQFLIGSDGKLYAENTYDTTGNYSSSGIQSPVGSIPVAVATSGSNLFVANTYQPLSTCSVNEPCSGSIGVYPILTAAEGEALTPVEIADSLGTPVTNPSTSATYWPLTLTGSSDIIVPTAVHVLASGAYVFVSAYDSTASPNASYIFAFAVGSGGVLSPVSGSPFAVTGGIKPSGIGSDSTSSYVYVTDSSTAKVYGFSVAASTGVLTSLSGSPYTAGNGPSSIAVDSTYAYAYVANATDGNVYAYSIGSNGALTWIGTYAAGIDPVAIGIDPSTNHFVFTANFTPDQTYGTVSDFEMDTTAGTLINTAGTPFKGNAQLTAVAAIPHHATQ